MILTHTSTLARVPTQEQIARSYGDSFWIKAAVRDAYNRDPVDALRDAEVLVVMLANRLADLPDVTAADSPEACAARLGLIDVKGPIPALRFKG